MSTPPGMCAVVFFRMMSHWYISRSLIVGHVMLSVIPELTRYATVRPR